MSNYIITTDGELMHYGIPGMKWGKRKARPEASDIRKRFDSAKDNYKQAKRAHSKAFNKAYSYSERHPVSQWATKKGKAESDKRWNDTFDKGVALDKAQKAYKSAKKDRKNSIQKTYDKMTKDSSIVERMLYNDATRKKAAKYMVDRNMSMSEAKKKANKEAIRNTAIAVAALGGYAALKTKQ